MSPAQEEEEQQINWDTIACNGSLISVERIFDFLSWWMCY